MSFFCEFADIFVDLSRSPNFFNFVNVMEKRDLLMSFVDALNQKVLKKSDLITTITDVLKIEKESVTRRMNGKVQFTIREMGILAKELDISLDQLLYMKHEYTPIQFKMDSPVSTTMDNLLEYMEEIISILVDQLDSDDLEMGAVVDSLPVELFIYYPNLCKFMYFKWGHNFEGTFKYSNYSEWEMPERTSELHQIIKSLTKKLKKKLYIWDRSLLWNLVNDIKYFSLIHILSPEDTGLIRGELHKMLIDLEELADGTATFFSNNEIFEVYVTNINVGITSVYYLSNGNYMSLFKAFFMRSVIHKDHTTGAKVQQWINSLKKISNLISGSGEKERKLFFEEQRFMIDTI